MNTHIPHVESGPATPPTELIAKDPINTLRGIALLYGVLTGGVLLVLFLLTLFIWYVAAQAGKTWSFGNLLMDVDLPLFICYIGTSCWSLLLLWKRRHFHTKEVEHAVLARLRALEAEVRVKEREYVLLRGDQIGNYPAVVNAETRHVLRLAPGNSLVKQAKEGQSITELTPQDAQDMAKLVDYWQIAYRVPPGHALLGVDPKTGEVVTCDFGYLLTTWIVGGSGRGKTNTVALKVYEAMQLGYKLVVIDPHKHKEDSLANKLAPFADAILGEIAWEEEHIEAVLDWFMETFEARRQGKGTKEKLLLIVDEVGNLARNEALVDKIKKIARTCGQETRGFGMAGYFISQQAAGLKWLRDSAITVIAHKLLMESERMLACNNHRDIAREMEAFPMGRVVVYGQAFDDMKVLQMSIFSADRLTHHTLKQRQLMVHEDEERASLQGRRGHATRVLEPHPTHVLAESVLEKKELPHWNQEQRETRGKNWKTRLEAVSLDSTEKPEDILDELKKILRLIGKLIGQEGNRILAIEPETLTWVRDTLEKITTPEEERAALLKRWSVLPGRAYQEIGLALDVLLAERKQGNILLVARKEVEDTRG